jgi:hypothetical protein
MPSYLVYQRVFDGRLKVNLLFNPMSNESHMVRFEKHVIQAETAEAAVLQACPSVGDGNEFEVYELPDPVLFVFERPPRPAGRLVRI